MASAGTESNPRRPYMIITNNPLVAERWPRETELVAGAPDAVYRAARNMVHGGHRLLTHPLAGSVKPNESPYRSVIVTRDPRPTVDFASLRLMEAALSALDKLVASSGLRYAHARAAAPSAPGAPHAPASAASVQLPPELDMDYRTIDAGLMESAIQSLNEF